MIDKKLTKYDRARLNDLKDKLSNARKDYLAICEALFIHDLHQPSKKQDYLTHVKWEKERVNLERRMRAIIRNYEKCFVQYWSLSDVITEEMSRNVY